MDQVHLRSPLAEGIKTKTMSHDWETCTYILARRAGGVRKKELNDRNEKHSRATQIASPDPPKPKLRYHTYLRFGKPCEKNNIEKRKGSPPLADYPSSSWPLGLQYTTIQRK